VCFWFLKEVAALAGLGWLDLLVCPACVFALGVRFVRSWC
jgi:hypothetical protein